MSPPLIDKVEPKDVAAALTYIRDHSRAKYGSKLLFDVVSDEARSHARFEVTADVGQQSRGWPLLGGQMPDPFRHIAECAHPGLNAPRLIVRRVRYDGAGDDRDGHVASGHEV